MRRQSARRNTPQSCSSTATQPMFSFQCLSPPSSSRRRPTGNSRFSLQPQQPIVTPALILRNSNRRGNGQLDKMSKNISRFHRLPTAETSKSSHGRLSFVAFPPAPGRDAARRVLWLTSPRSPHHTRRPWTRRVPFHISRTQPGRSCSARHPFTRRPAELISHCVPRLLSLNPSSQSRSAHPWLATLASSAFPPDAFSCLLVFVVAVLGSFYSTEERTVSHKNGPRPALITSVVARCPLAPTLLEHLRSRSHTSVLDHGSHGYH